MKTNAKTKTATTTNARKLYAALERDAAAVLRNAASRTYTPIVRELQNAASNDHTARNAPQIAEQIREVEQTHAAHIKGAEHFTRVARNIKLTPAERATAAALAADFTNKAASERRTIDTLYSALDTTYSDRADIVQEIALAMLEQPTDKERATAEQAAPARAIKYAEKHRTPSAFDELNAGRAAAAFIEQDEDTAAAVIAADAERRHRQNAGGRYIRSMRGVCALDTYHTDSIPADEKTRAAWIAAGHELGKDYKYITDTATISIEYREKDKRGAGWYKVTRRRTIKAGNSYEEMTEGGEVTAIKHTRNTYADTLAAVEQIAALASRAELTERERRFLHTFCTAAARVAGEESRRAYIESRAAEGKKPTAAGLHAAQYSGRLAYCFDKLSINTRNAQDLFFFKLRRRLQAVDRRTTNTAPDFEPSGFDYYKHLTESNRGTRYTDNAPRADLLAWIFNK